MTDNTPTADSETKSAPVTNLPLVIHAQYLKDLSFENPQAPDTLKSGLVTPTMDVQIGLESSPKSEVGLSNLYEVSLRLTVKATRPDQTIFIADMKYAALVSLDGVPEEHHAPLLLIEVPRVIFPYARQILGTTVISGGYPPLYLNPIDFSALFRERFAGHIGSVTTPA